MAAPTHLTIMSPSGSPTAFGPLPSPLPLPLRLARGLSVIKPAATTDEKDTWQALNLQRKTKITCTLGPATNTVENISELLRSGMNVARFNFSHGSHESHQEMLDTVRKAVAATGVVCALMLDTKGPEIRTGMLKGGVARLTNGSDMELWTAAPADFVGDEKCVGVDYRNLPLVVSVGSIIKIDDGLIVCKVLSCDPANNRLRVRIQNTAALGNRKGVNLPEAKVDLPDVTEKDISDFGFAVRNNMDFIAASFMRKASAVQEIRRHLGEAGKNIQIISKIENQEGLDNFDEILEASDGIMVARGDLGVEIPIQKVVTAQKMMIRKCNIAAKPVITATQMLESMVSNPRPTRAEATDVANAVFDGTDCVMLSGETAKGEHPFAACQTMARICRMSERAIDYEAAFNSIVAATKKPISKAEAITSSAVKAAIDLTVGAILAMTESGSTARWISKYKPGRHIVALTTHERTARQLLLSRSVYPVVVPKGETDESLRQRGYDAARAAGWVKTGDEVVIVAGTPGQTGTTVSMRILAVTQ